MRWKFNVNGCSRLIAIGNFGDDQEFRHSNYPVIAGRTDAGAEITLFDCKVMASRLYKDNESQVRVRRDIVFDECWIGNVSYKSKEELLFDEISFGINNLNWWVGDSTFEYNIQDEFNEISFNVGNKVVLYEDANVNIVIKHCPEIHSINPGELELGIADHLRVVIHSKIGLIPYYPITSGMVFLSNYVDKIYSFLSLLIGENPYPYDIRGSGGCRKAYLRVKRDIIVRERGGGMDSLRVLFPRQILSCLDIRNVVLGFMDIYDKATTGIKYLTGFNIRSQLYAQYTLPEAIYNFEGLESVLYDGSVTAAEYSLSNANKGILDGILDKCEAREKNFLESRFKRKTITLKERISHVLNDVHEVFPYVKGIEDGVLKILVEVRNNYSHYGQGDFTDPYNYVALVHFVNYLTVSLVLYKSGMPTKVIAACLNKIEGDYLGIKYNFERCFPVATEKYNHKK